MQATLNMNRFLLSLYIICLVHAQVPQNCVNSMVVSDIEGGSSGYLAKLNNLDHIEDNQQLQQQQQQTPHHHLRHTHNQQNHHHHHHYQNHNNNINSNHRNSHNAHHHQAEQHLQTGEHHHVDAGHHNDVEIGHTQPNMVNWFSLLLLNLWTNISELNDAHAITKSTSSLQKCPFS